MSLALDVSGLTTQGPLGRTVLFAALAAGLLAAAVAGIALTALLSRPRRTRGDGRTGGAHAPDAPASVWRSRIDAVVARYDAGGIGRPEAFAELAAIVREFASAALGRDLSAQTLADLARLPRTDRNREDIDLLRHTVAALYPPEFADGTVNEQARGTGVDEAAGWARNLVERWRR